MPEVGSKFTMGSKTTISKRITHDVNIVHGTQATHAILVQTTRTTTNNNWIVDTVFKNSFHYRGLSRNKASQRFMPATITNVLGYIRI